MDFYLRDISTTPYRISEPQQIATPRLLLFHDRLDKNIRKMNRLLKAINPSYDLGLLCPHVKTHKSIWVTQQLMQSGIGFFKATPNEVEMLANSGAQKIFVSYPLLEHTATRLAELIKQNDHIEFFVQIGHPVHAKILHSVAQQHDISWNYFLDLDVGMGRTGLSIDNAFSFYRSIPRDGRFRFAGLHAYDGHNHFETAEERQMTAARSIYNLLQVLRQFEHNSVRVEKTVIGGTPSFLEDLKILSKIDLDTELYLSPGTWIYFDTKYNSLMPGTFEVAACILAQIMDKPAYDRATLNLGHKRWAVDQGPVEVFSVDGMKALSWSEEHTVVGLPKDSEHDIGDYILVAPRHVCPTVNLWESFSIIGHDGKIEIANSPVDARNR